MREMKDSGIEWIGQISEDWNIKRLKAVLCERNESNNPIKTDYILSLTNDRGVIPYDEKGDVGNKSKEDVSGYKLAYPNDIVLNSMNVIIGSVGLSKYYGCVSPVYYMLYPRNPMDDVRYYNYIFQTKEFQSKLKGYGNGIMEIRMRIQMSKLNTVELPIPDATTQTRIADFLDEKCGKIDRYIEKQQQVIEKLKTYKQSVITEAVTFRDGWTSCHLGYLAQFKNGLNYSGISTDVEIKFLGVGDFQNYFMLDSEEMFSTLKFDGNMPEDLLLKNGDIVFVRSNGSKELVGRSVLIDNVSYPLTYSGFCIRMRNYRQDVVLNKFLLYRFWSNEFRQSLNRDSRGSNINNLNQDLLAKLTVAFPNVDKQREIISFLDKKCAEIDSAIDKKQALIDKMAEYKKSLIYETITGKLEV